ncbi:unnamed protein product [Cladocopium goreaui]|uniref:Ribosomal protein S6 kinase alpha-5 n=1 Tax=Cladocopium goreaui TaxID=2562237 RepID=A0A9P1DFA3_9DINO|nr:unnamed protein product [Cladocopium goreaui]
MDLQKQRANEIRQLRENHDHKIESILEGYSKKSREFEALKAERELLLEALGVTLPKESAESVQESSEAAPPPRIDRGQSSSNPLVARVLFSELEGNDHQDKVEGIPNLDFLKENDSNVYATDSAESDPPPVPASQLDPVIAALQEQIQNLRDDMQSQSKKKSKAVSSSSSSSVSSQEIDSEYIREQKLMRLKAYEKIKIPSLPKSAAEVRTWKNSLISQLVSCCKSSEKELLSWLQRPLDGDEEHAGRAPEFPVLNRVLGSKLLELSKGNRFSIDFQSLQERSVRIGMQAPGLLLVAKICKRFRLDKEKGMSLSQQHLLSLKPQGVEIKDLEIFRDRVEFILSSLETTEYPSESILRTWLYACLKATPKLNLRVDKFREAATGSSYRTFQYLWQSMLDVIDEAQHDQNTTSVLSTLRAKVDTAAAQATDDKKKKDKKDKKDKKEKQTPESPAAPFTPKAKPSAKADPKAKPKEAKQDALPARRINQPHVMSDGKPSEKFGDRIHADHIIISKDRLSDGHKGLNGESVCLILYDDFTKIVAAYPAKTKSTDQCIRACNHFLGSRPAQELHSDNAPELEACAAKIGLVPDLTVPYRKTAEINRKIRTIEDCVRCCLVQIGNQNAAWPLAVEYTTSAMTLDVWRLADIVIEQGGRVHFEWPTHCHGWNEVAPEEFPIVSLSIHELIDRREWINDPAALAEIKKEADGLVNAGTWTYDHVVPRAKLEADARASGKDIAIGRLLTIVSWKNAESTTLKKLKARICFRGDEVRDAFGQYAEFQELKVIPTTISGLNLLRVNFIKMCLE